MKNNQQEVDFRNINDFLDFLPEDHLKIVEALRSLVFECIPDVVEKLSYNVPFYHRFAGICFIWPGSINWGSTRRTGVDLGFLRGNLLSDPSYLDIGNRKQIYVKTFHDTKEINPEILRQLLYEAVVIDEEREQSKRKRRSNKKIR